MQYYSRSLLLFGSFWNFSSWNITSPSPSIWWSDKKRSHMFFLLHVGCIWQDESKQIHGFPNKTSNHFKNFQEILEPHLALGSAHTATCFFLLRISNTSVSSNFGFRRPPLNFYETKWTMGKCWSIWTWLKIISWKFHPAGKNNR